MFSSRRGRPLVLLLFLALSLEGVLASVASAQPAPPPAPARTTERSAEIDGLSKERSQLRLDLGRINAEIDRLKNAGGGLRDDYRLRSRMADAEAIARRLTEIDAQLQARAPSGGATAAAKAGPPQRLDLEPGAAPTDGPPELEAKADILADQARRAEQQTVALQARVNQLRGRQELRRRSGQLEHDPFAPLEGSKRRMMIVAPASVSNMASSGPGGDKSVPTTASNGITPPVVGAATPAPVASASVSLRDTLDANTLAEIRKLEQGGAPASSIEAVQRAIDALKARAQRLDAQSKALRDQARKSR